MGMRDLCYRTMSWFVSSYQLLSQYLDILELSMAVLINCRFFWVLCIPVWYIFHVYEKFAFSITFNHDLVSLQQEYMTGIICVGLIYDYRSLCHDQRVVVFCGHQGKYPDGRSLCTVWIVCNIYERCSGILIRALYSWSRIVCACGSNAISKLIFVKED
jgi:hypothetical protein